MIRWSRVRLALSIVAAEGFWRTWLDRFKYARPATPDLGGTRLPDDVSGDPQTTYDYSAVVHIHSTYSDGTGTVAEIAASAQRAGVDIVLLSDHNSLEAAEAGEETWHENGRVLVVVGTEATTTHGHLLVFGVPTSAIPLPFDAVEAMQTIDTSGGYGYIALPCDLKGFWKDFGIRRPGIGLEVFNLSSIARTKINLPGFLLALVRYRGRNPLSAFSLIAGRPNDELRVWDDMLAESQKRNEPLPMAIGSLDAHAVMRIARQEYPYPTYEEVFRTLRTHVLLNRELSRDASNTRGDLALVHEALRSGRSYVSYDNFADPTGFRFELLVNERVVATSGQGWTAQCDPQATIRLRVGTAEAKSVIRLFRNGKVWRVQRGPAVEFAISEPGVYRPEVYLYKYRVGNVCIGSRPWIFGNAIQVSTGDVANANPAAK